MQHRGHILWQYTAVHNVSEVYITFATGLGITRRRNGAARKSVIISFLVL